MEYTFTYDFDEIDVFVVDESYFLDEMLAFLKFLLEIGVTVVGVEW